MEKVTLGIHFVLRTNKINNGLAPIYARITVNSKRCELSVKRSILSSAWNVGKGMAKPSCPENKQLNSYLEQIRKMMVEAYQDLVISKQVVTAEAIKNKFYGLDISDMTLIKLIDYHNLNCKETLRWGTLKNYYTTKKYIELFLKQKHRTSDIFLKSLNYKFLMDFEYFMRNYQPEDFHSPMGNNTVMKHIERLRKMIKMAMRYEWLEKDPFAAFRQKFHHVERGYLSEEELKIIEERDFSISRLKYIKDLFVFACYTGFAYVDVMKLTPNDIQIGIDKKMWIFTKREKTDNPVRIPLLPKPLEIINEYKTDIQAVSHGRLFPPISNQKLNSYLKEVADICGIKKNLTFHLARHTFATTVTLSNGVPIESVSKMLGHSLISTTQIYAKVVEKKLGEDMDMLNEKLKSKKDNQRNESNAKAC
ncbi:MAG TPA: site-specific integrase [Prolixibacteraceae bacterium]|nr:site-specific integrase [Prolixibacteraceae bacterium]